MAKGLKGASGKASGGTPFRDSARGAGPSQAKATSRKARATGGKPSSARKGVTSPVVAPKTGKISNPVGKYRGGRTS
jgi:hypothetical protein